VREDVLYDLRRNDLAGTAPGCEGIEDDDLVVLKRGLELGFAVHLSVSIHTPSKHCRLSASQPWTRPARGGTYLERLWTPILTADCLNPRAKVWWMDGDVVLVVLSSVVDDLKRSDINCLARCSAV